MYTGFANLLRGNSRGRCFRISDLDFSGKSIWPDPLAYGRHGTANSSRLITALKQLPDTKVEHSVTRLQSIDAGLLVDLFDLSPDVAFFIKDCGGRYVFVNDSLVARHGLKSKAEVIGKRPCDICPGEFGQIPAEQDSRVLTTGKALIDQLEMQWHRPHSPVWCLTTKLPIRDADHQVIGLIGYSRDLRQSLDLGDIPSSLARALRDFEKSLSSDVTPSVLAERAELSAQRLSRLTKRLFGLTPSQLITKTRIAAASRLLRDSSDTISNIAHSCGFCDHSAFTRAFRSATGVTPSEYRNAGS